MTHALEESLFSPEQLVSELKSDSRALGLPEKSVEPIIERVLRSLRIRAPTLSAERTPSALTPKKLHRPPERRPNINPLVLLVRPEHQERPLTVPTSQQSNNFTPLCEEPEEVFHFLLTR